jgi:hypothetical protein
MVVIDGKSVSDRNPIATSFHDSIVVIGSSKMNLDRRLQFLSEYRGSGVEEALEFHPLGEDAWQRSSATGNSPDREAIHRHIESRDIDNPVDQKSGNFIVENPT